MYPPQTSLIPTLAALVRYIETSSFWSNYPFWYLGTTPVRYLTGPVLPGLLIVLRRFSGFSYITLIIFVIIITIIISSFAWGILVKYLTNSWKKGIIAIVMTLLFP